MVTYVRFLDTWRLGNIPLGGADRSHGNHKASISKQACKPESKGKASTQVLCIAIQGNGQAETHCRTVPEGQKASKQCNSTSVEAILVIRNSLQRRQDNPIQTYKKYGRGCSNDILQAEGRDLQMPSDNWRPFDHTVSCSQWRRIRRSSLLELPTLCPFERALGRRIRRHARRKF